MAERVWVEALLRSEFGIQRLSRVGANQFSRISLVPREPPVHEVVVWRDGVFRVESRSHDGAPESVTPLKTGQRFLVGATEVEFECITDAWRVDLDRERALLEREDAPAWSIYTDELLARGDRLGSVLARTGELDVAFDLEVRPLLVTGRLEFRADERGLWRELTFNHDLHRGEFEVGLLGAVLTQPIAWFVRRVTIAFRPPRRASVPHRTAVVSGAVAQIARFASPHLSVISLPNLPPRDPLPSAREGITVERS